MTCFLRLERHFQSNRIDVVLVSLRRARSIYFIFVTFHTLFNSIQLDLLKLRCTWSTDEILESSETLASKKVFSALDSSMDTIISISRTKSASGIEKRAMYI